MLLPNRPPALHQSCSGALQKNRLNHVMARAAASEQHHSSSGSYASVRRQVLAGLSLLASCPCCSQAGAAPEEEPIFLYGGPNEDASWGGKCATGQLQSPIDLPLAGPNTSITLPDPFLRSSKQQSQGRTCSSGILQIRYQDTNQARVKNTGNGTMQVNLPPGSEVDIGPDAYQLLQYHFHSPSEHTMASRPAAMEVHLVHKNTTTGGFAVLGVLLEPTATAPHPGLAAALAYAPGLAQQEEPCPLAINPLSLLPKPDSGGERHWVHYTGSLTTPPCSEEVEWFVFKEQVAVTPQQVKDFAQYVSHIQPQGRNARPVRPLNGRPIFYDCLTV